MKVLGTDRVLLIFLLGRELIFSLGRSHGKGQGKSRNQEREIKGMKGKKKIDSSGAERVRPTLIPYSLSPLE